tara:strand:+ start:51 stop:722 length:672 start_codon:yes stop_codon:yes gene_type:complete
METKYHLENIESKPLHGEYTVQLCNYLIYNNKYILYLLEIINGHYYFPHFISKENVLEEAKHHFNKLHLNGTIKGYYVVDATCYILIHLTMETIKYNISPYTFVSIYEILFMRSCLGKPIDNSVIQLYIHYPYLLYLYNTTRLAIPELGYYNTTKSDLNFHAYIGLDPDEEGNIIIYNMDGLPEGEFLRVLSSIQHYNVKQKSTIKSRHMIIDDYMIVSYHKN